MANAKPRLTYTDGRGYAEVIRLALAAAKIEYENVYLRTHEQFLQLIKDGKLMFNQVPLLEMDEQCLIGSECNARYVCNKANLVGKTEEDRTKIEMLAMGARDMLKPGLTNYMFKATPELQKAALENVLQETKKRYLPVFEKHLAENKSGFLVGESLSMADIMLFDGLTFLNDKPGLKGELANFPHCRTFINHISNQPGIKEYLASPHRHPPVDEEHVKEVLRVFNRKTF